MRLFPFLSEDIRVGIDITIDSIRMVAIDASDALARLPSDSTGAADVLSIWEFEFDLFDAFDPENPTGWMDAVCQTLQKELPENTRIRETSTSISLPSSWLHWGTNNSPTDALACASRLFGGAPFFSAAHTKSWPLVPLKSDNFDDSGTPAPMVFASVAEDVVLRIATCLQSRGYRVDWVIPDGVAVGLNRAVEVDQSSPCVVMLHRDGGTITILDDGIPALVRTLPPIQNSSDRNQLLPSKSPCAADVRNWSEIVGHEIQATFDYYARCSGQWKFTDRITPESPIVFAGSLFPVLQQAGYDCADLLGQWSNDVERPVSLWSCERLISPVFGHADSEPETNPEQASALSLAMFSMVSDEVDLNLLPPAFNLRNRYRNVQFRWAVASVIAAVLTLMFGINSYLHQRESLAAEQDRIAIIEPIRSHLKQLESVTEAYRRKLDLIEKIAKGQPTDDGLQALAAISDAMDANTVALKSAEVDFVSGTWNLSGSSETEKALVQMADRLKQTGWVQNDAPTKGAESVIVSALKDSTRDSGHETEARSWVRDADGSFRWTPRLGSLVSIEQESDNEHAKSDQLNVTIADRQEVQR